MHIETLKIFCDLAETENFTRVGQVNEVSQSAVSQKIHSLERHFASVLIERSRRKFRLTREGQVVYDYGKRIINACDSMTSQMQEIREAISGNIRVSTIYSIGFHELQPCLKKYLKAYPAVHVHVEYRRSHEVYQDVFGNGVDLGLVAYPVNDSRLETVVLGQERLVIICHPQHLLAQKNHASLAALAGQRFIGFAPDLPTSKAIDNLLKDHSVQVRSVMNFDNVETVKCAVETDAGVSIVPESAITQEVQDQTLARVEIEDGEFYRPLGAIVKKSKVLSPAIKELLATLQGGEATGRPGSP